MIINTTIDMFVLAALALLSVSLWTARVALTAQRRRLAAATMAAVEATVFAIAFSRLLVGLDNPLGLLVYAAGVAGGTAVTLIIDDSLNPKLVKVEIVDPTGHDRLQRALRAGGWPATIYHGQGLTGPVATFSVTITADQLVPLTDAVGRAGAQAFWTVSPVQRARPVPVPHGFTQTAVTSRLPGPGRRDRDGIAARSIGTAECHR